jgi:hypothetical protein
MDNMFPGDCNIKTRNASGNRLDSDDETLSPPAKKNKEQNSDNTSPTDTGVKSQADVAHLSPPTAPALAGPAATVNTTPTDASGMEVDTGDTGSKLRNQTSNSSIKCFQKMNSVKEVTNVVRSRVEAVESTASKTAKQVEIHTFLLRLYY